MGALGGDASALSINPAGLGLYRHGEITFSPSVVHSSSTAKFYGQTNEADDISFTVNNISYVQVNKRNKGPWKSFQLEKSDHRMDS